MLILKLCLKDLQRLKLDPRQVQDFLANPQGVRAVLLYGEDEGLIRDRGNRLTRSVVGRLDDPFRVAELDRDTHNRLLQEIPALSLTGGRRVVRVRDVSDALNALVQSALSQPGDALLILEAGALAAKSKLRVMAETRKDVVTIACYHEDGGGLERSIQRILDETNTSIDRPALQWLATRLGNDRGATWQEVEKLRVYCSPDKKITLAVAVETVGDLADLRLDDALFSATEGDVAGADRALDAAMAEGGAPVAILRAALIHLQRLQRARMLTATGASPDAVVEGLRPPIFYQRKASFRRALGLWTVPDLEAAARFISMSERDCKRTGSPAEILCRNAIIFLARRGRIRSDGSSLGL